MKFICKDNISKEITSDSYTIDVFGQVLSRKNLKAEYTDKEKIITFNHNQCYTCDKQDISLKVT